MRFKETDVAEPVVLWLQRQGWEVFQEVSVGGGRRADIVARKDGLLWIVEVKTTLNLEIMGQAAEWKGWAHRVNFAVPSRSGRKRYAWRHGGLQNRPLKVVRAVHQVYGVGCIMVRMQGRVANPADRVHESFAPEPVDSPRLADYVSRSLFEEQKTFAKAGSSGEFWTAFKGTAKRMAEYVALHHGCTIREVVDSIETHYHSKASARSQLLRLAQEGVIDGVRVEKRRQGKVDRYRLYPDLLLEDE